MPDKETLEERVGWEPDEIVWLDEQGQPVASPTPTPATG